MAVADLSQEGGVLVRKERSLWEESLIRLVKNKVAVISACLLYTSDAADE